MSETSTHPRSHRRSRRRLAATALIAGLALIGAACGGDDDGDSASASGDGGDDALTLSISDPGDGADVGEPFDVALDSSVPLGEPDTGRHHVHLYYDGNTAEGEYDLVYGTSATVDRLDPGEHTIEAVIANADHSLTDARDEITVTVGEGDGGSGGGTNGDDAPTTTSGMDSGSSDYGY